MINNSKLFRLMALIASVLIIATLLAAPFYAYAQEAPSENPAINSESNSLNNDLVVNDKGASSIQNSQEPTLILPAEQSNSADSNNNEYQSPTSKDENELTENSSEEITATDKPTDSNHVYTVHYEKVPSTSSDLQIQSSNDSSNAPSVSLSIRAHIQTVGWNQGWRTASASADKTGTLLVGTSGQALRLEALQFQVKGINGGVNCQVHVQSIGWQAAQGTSGTAGTSGQALRLESVRIGLTDELSQWYDIEYRTHVQNDGWKSWVSNGAESGTTGRGLRMEALEVRLIPKKTKATTQEGIVGVRSWAHVENIGNTTWVRDGTTQGTTGRALRVEALELQLDKGIYSGSIEYRTHVQGVGWTSWSHDGQLSGTTGKALRMEAFQVRLKGDIAKVYEVVYRAHVQSIGWQDWVSGDNVAGTTGRALRLEAFQVQLIRRPSVPQASRTVDDGMYTMTAYSAGGLAAGTANASNDNGANIQVVSNANWRLEEKWIITWKGDGYELFNVNSGKVLDAANGASNLVANARQANRSNAKNQRWAIQPVSGGGYQIIGMNQGSILTIQDNKIANGSNLLLWSPSGSNSQRFNLNKTELFYAGTYQLFTKLDQNGKSATVSNSSLSNGTQIVTGAATDGPDQHFIFAANGSGYTIQVVSSGKYLTVSGDNIIQTAKNNSASQLWTVARSESGGIVLVSAATGRVITVQGNRNANGVGLQQLSRNDSLGQRWYPIGRSLLTSGLYELRTAQNNSIILDVAGGSYANGTNVMVHSRNGGNNQKFLFTAVKDGYYRISMPLSSTVLSVQGASKNNGANVRMETWSESNAQLWKPVVTDGGLTFVNLNSGQSLSFAAATAGSNVQQTANPGSSVLQKWSVVKTTFNPNDLLSYRMAICNAAGGGNLTLSNAVPGYSISQARWNQLVNALNGIWGQGVGVGFILLDENTGMTVSLNADVAFYGASTVKALWVTYLFQEYLEKGRVSWGEVAWYIETAIVDSDNDSYLYLRSCYGSEAEFDQWLAAVGVGHIDTWDWYSPRTLALAWTHMLQYSKSSGRFVGTWQNTFSHSYYSMIHEGIGGYRTTWSKPGWVTADYRRGDTLDDAAIVDDRNGRRYLVTIMTGLYPYGNIEPMRNLVRALDAIHMEMPRSR